MESISDCCLASTIALRLGYLRVGERGWIFDVGIAGPWAWDQGSHRSQATSFRQFTVEVEKSTLQGINISPKNGTLSRWFSFSQGGIC